MTDEEKVKKIESLKNSGYDWVDWLIKELEETRQAFEEAREQNIHHIILRDDVLDANLQLSSTLDAAKEILSYYANARNYDNCPDPCGTIHADRLKAKEFINRLTTNAELQSRCKVVMGKSVELARKYP